DTRALIETLEQTARHAHDADEEKQLRVRIAQLETGAAEKDVARAVTAWQAVLDVDATDKTALAELETLHTRAGDWLAVQEIQALARAADIWEGPLDNPDAAGEILEKILRREPGSVTALTRLAKIYERAGDWDKCGEVLQKALALGPKGRDAADLFYRLGEVA